MPKLNRDLLNSADPAVVARTAFGIIDNVQHQTPELQALAVAAVFEVITDVFNVPPQDLYTVISNIKADENNDGRLTFLAIRDYVQKELKH